VGDDPTTGFSVWNRSNSVRPNFFALSCCGAVADVVPLFWSRIRDYKHDSVEILAGFVLGVVVAWLVFARTRLLVPPPFFRTLRPTFQCDANNQL
jgi:membrane-associated phospholipid phosphatase